MVVMLKQCCCGCTPRTGALIIAVVFAIVSALLVVMFSLCAVVSSEEYSLLVKELESESEDHSITTTTTHGPADDLDDYSDEHRLSLDTRITVLKFWKSLTVLLTLTESLDFLLSVLLMFAADKESARHVRLWLLGFCAVSCSRSLMLFILNGVIFYAKPADLGTFVLVIVTLLTAGSGYSLLVVFSYYRQLVGTAIPRRLSQQEDSS